MFSVKEIVTKNGATYYRFDPQNRISRTPLLVALLLLCTACAFLVSQPSNDFLAGVISAEAILAGFSFNVLFYLVSNRLTKPGTWKSLEHEKRFERLVVLASEIFDNVCYFNLVAVICIILGLTMLLLNSGTSAESLSMITHRVDATGSLAKFYKAGTDIKHFFSIINLTTLFFALIESFVSFTRTVTRVRYYFYMLKTMNDDNTNI